MYSLVVLLSMLATSLFLRGYTGDERPARRWPVLFGLALAASLYTHNWALFLGIAMGVAWLGLLSSRRARSAARGCATALLGFGLTALLYLPWLPTLLFQAAHTGAPWSRKPEYEDLTMEATHRLLGHTAWLVLVVGAGGGVVALVRAGRGLKLTAEGRAVLAVGDRGGRDGAARLRGLADLTGVGDALHGDRRAALPAAVRGRARRRARHRAADARDRGDPVGLRRVAADEEQRAPGDEAIAPSLRPGDSSSRPSPTDARAPPLPAAGAALRDADGLVERRRRDGWRDGVDRLRANSPRATSSRSSTGSSPGAGSCSSRRSFRRRALARAVDRARRRALGGVRPVRQPTTPASSRRRCTRRRRASASQPGQRDRAGQEPALTASGSRCPAALAAAGGCGGARARSACRRRAGRPA